jgi:protein-S-isoprenylcysteine O-methyltransferase Ste14
MRTLAKILYGALFVIVVPGLLMVWARAAGANVPMPVYGSPMLGGVFVVAGLGLMSTAIFELWSFGGGLPMNAFPPPRLVMRGTFRMLPHPIYTGFVLVCLGTSMATRSACGLWLVTPSTALACASLVFGYEHPDLQRRFGQTLRVLPPDDDCAPSTVERLRFIVLVLVPWLALYELTIHLPMRGTAFGLQWEARLPIFSWTTLIYQSTYVVVGIAPWFARTRSELRKLMISGWTAMAVTFPIYWLIPSSAPRRPLLEHNWIAKALMWERKAYPPTASFPSFHVLWAVIVARVYRRPRWLGASFVGAVAVSCVTTGMHYIADVLAALAIAPFFYEPRLAWRGLQHGAEWLANSWGSGGSVRFA